MADVIQVEPTTTRNLRELLQTSYELRQVSERNAAQTHEALLVVARRLCAAKADRDRRAIDAFNAAELAQWIIDDVADRLEELEWYRTTRADGQRSSTDLPDLALLQQQVATLQQEVDHLQATRQTDEARRQQLISDNEQLRQQLEEMRFLATPISPERTSVAPLESSAVDPTLWPDWMQRWKTQPGYERERQFLMLVGQSWECRRPRLVALYAQQRGVGAEGGAVNDLPKRLNEMNPPLVEIKKVGEKIRIPGQPPTLLALTPIGSEAYRLLCGEQPRRAYQEYERRHKSVEQVMLVLAAIDLLEAFGHTVDRFPDVVNLPEGRVYAPDLVASLEARTLSIEVETGSGYRNGEDRSKKWRNAAEATGGQIYIITPDRQMMQGLLSEVMSWSVDYRGKLELRLTNITDLGQLRRAEQPLPNGTIWLQKRGC